MARGAWDRAVLTGVVFVAPESIGLNPYRGVGGDVKGDVLPYNPAVLQAIQGSELSSG